MHFQEASHCPFDLLRVATYDADGQLIFKHPMWLMVSGHRRLPAQEARKAYLHRSTEEHLFRFLKQKLLFEAAEIGSVEQDERWSDVVGLAYWNLYVVRDIVGRSVRPWERYKPTPPESGDMHSRLRSYETWPRLAFHLPRTTCKVGTNGFHQPTSSCWTC